MSTDWFFARLAEWGSDRALVANDRSTSYAEIRALCDEWTVRLRERQVGPGVAVAIEGFHVEVTMRIEHAKCQHTLRA